MRPNETNMTLATEKGGHVSGFRGIVQEFVAICQAPSLIDRVPLDGILEDPGSFLRYRQSRPSLLLSLETFALNRWHACNVFILYQL